MASGLIAKVGITVDGKQAQDTLKALQTSVDLTKKKIEELQEKLSKNGNRGYFLSFTIHFLISKFAIN